MLILPLVVMETTSINLILLLITDPLKFRGNGKKKLPACGQEYV